MAADPEMWPEVQKYYERASKPQMRVWDSQYKEWISSPRPEGITNMAPNEAAQALIDHQNARHAEYNIPPMQMYNYTVDGGQLKVIGTDGQVTTKLVTDWPKPKTETPKPLKSDLGVDLSAVLPKAGKGPLKLSRESVSTIRRLTGIEDAGEPIALYPDRRVLVKVKPTQGMPDDYVILHDGEVRDMTPQEQKELLNIKALPKSMQPKAPVTHYHGSSWGFDRPQMPAHGGEGFEDLNLPMPNAIHFTEDRGMANRYALANSGGKSPTVYNVNLDLKPGRKLSIEYGRALPKADLERLQKAAPGIDWSNIWDDDDTAYSKFNRAATAEVLQKAGYDAVEYYDESPEWEGPAVAVVNPDIVKVLSKRSVKGK